MIIINTLYLLLGLLLVVKGADILLSSAIAYGKKYKISDFFIGLIIVGFGTSLAELLVSVDAILKNAPDLSIGNVVGSNISNILLVSGVALFFSNINLKNISKFDITFHLISHILFLLIIWVYIFNFVAGVLFITLFIFYIYKSFQRSSNENVSELDIDDFLTKLTFSKPLIYGVPITASSILITLIGAELTVNSVITISKFFGISESFLALTIVAIGTSLPEIITSIRAAQKKRAELIIGNIIGSNIYNLLLILGLVSLFEAFNFSKDILLFEVIFLVLCVIGLSLLLFFKKELKSQNSFLFLIIYSFYLLNLYFNNF